MAYSVPATHTLNKPILQGLQVSSATAAHPLGDTVRGSDGKEYMYVYMQCSADPMYTGAPLVWVDTTGNYVVTPDVSDAVDATNESNNGFAGLATMYCSDSDNVYIWMQTKGLADSALVSTTVVVNGGLVLGPGASNCLDYQDGFMNSTLDSNFTMVGIALTAAAAGVTKFHSTASIMLF